MKYVLSAVIAASALIAAPIASAEVDGAKLAKQICSSCHNFEAAERTKTGPNLNGIVGRDIASASNFTRYSKELKEIGAKKEDDKNLTWTTDRLTSYISNTTDFLQKNSSNDKARSTMVFKKLTDEEVAAVVTYLGTL